jgi:hypothetical protein
VSINKSINNKTAFSWTDKEIKKLSAYSALENKPWTSQI